MPGSASNLARPQLLVGAVSRRSVDTDWQRLTAGEQVRHVSRSSGMAHQEFSVGRPRLAVRRYGRDGRRKILLHGAGHSLSAWEAIAPLSRRERAEGREAMGFSASRACQRWREPAAD